MSRPADKSRGRRTLLLLTFFALTPIVASYAGYYLFTPSKRVNYGELLDPLLAASAKGVRLDGQPFAFSDIRGKWVLVVVGGPDCGDTCRRALYATRQARTIQGRDQDRIARVWLQPAGASLPVPELLAEHPDLIAARVDPGEMARLPIKATGRPGILLLDPRGNLVLRYPADPDVKGLAKDLERLLGASQIG
jgi:cytochrome oxidase Cu insertion factor (SCO1/SenC/PrrC family)